MNGNFPRHCDDDDRLDPELTRLFDEAAAHEPATGETFVSSVLLKMQRARRSRLRRQVTGVTVVMLVSAFLAPYVAQQTLLVAGWFTERLPATGTALVSPIGCLFAALFAWRIVRWARTY
jgi:hypothetical protein